MLRCQFLCHVLIALCFIKIALKLVIFAKKCKIFEHWGLCPQTSKTAPPLRTSGYAPGCAFERRSPLEFGEKSAPVLAKTFFWSSPELGEKKCSIFGEDLFFGLHLICSTEKKSWSRFIPSNVENRSKLG